jgi:hypothetical protein
MHVDDLAEARENDVRRSGKVSPMEAKAIAKAMNKSPDD